MVICSVRKNTELSTPYRPPLQCVESKIAPRMEMGLHVAHLLISALSDKMGTLIARQKDQQKGKNSA